jgi:DNA-binding transcriptional LysR family regulator
VKDYIQTHGLPTRDNLEKHTFVQSEYYAARTGLWDSWLAALSRGRVAHHCDSMMSYAMMVKVGHGIGLLGSYSVIEPCAVPLDIGVRVSVPLFLIALTERLKAPPVRFVFDWLSETFGPNNPWFADQFRLNNPPSEHDAGMRIMFNLEESAATNSLR